MWAAFKVRHMPRHELLIAMREAFKVRHEPRHGLLMPCGRRLKCAMSHVGVLHGPRERHVCHDGVKMNEHQPRGCPLWARDWHEQCEPRGCPSWARDWHDQHEPRGCPLWARDWHEQHEPHGCPSWAP